MKTAAIILAAGMSRRMGTPKALLPFAGTTVLARVVQTLRDTNEIAPIIVVTGFMREKIEASLQQFEIQFAHNEDFENGEMFSSVRCGVRALPENSDFFIALCDQPGIEISTLQVLCAAQRESKISKIAIPTFNGRRGHPVLFSASCATEILDLPAGATLRDMMKRHAQEILEVPVNDAEIREDLDTPEDYQRAILRWNEKQKCKSCGTV